MRSIGGTRTRRRPTQRKGRPVIDLPRIAQAALNQIRRTGVAKMTVTAIADELGVTPRALYHYVADREQILRLAVRHWVAHAPTLAHTHDWRADLTDYISRSRHYIAHTPGLTDVGLVEGIVDYSDEFYQFQEQKLRRIVAIGFPAREALVVLIEITRFIDAMARIYGADRSHWNADEAMAEGITFLLQRPEHYPLSIAAGVIGEQDQLEIGVELLLDGIEAYRRRVQRKIATSR